MNMFTIQDLAFVAKDSLLSLEDSKDKGGGWRIEASCDHVGSGIA